MCENTAETFEEIPLHYYILLKIYFRVYIPVYMWLIRLKLKISKEIPETVEKIANIILDIAEFCCEKYPLSICFFFALWLIYHLNLSIFARYSRNLPKPLNASSCTAARWNNITREDTYKNAL